MSIQKEIGQYLPDEKVSALTTDSDSLVILRRIGGQKQKTITQRDRRPHLMAEEILPVADTEVSTCQPWTYVLLLETAMS